MHKQKGNIKIIVLLVAAFVLVAFYFFSSKSSDSEMMKDSRETSTMPKENSLMEEEVVEDEITAESDRTVVVYTPSGLFSEAEKTELGQKLIAPFLEFNLENDTRYLTVDITKHDPLPDHGYRYEVDAIGEGGLYTAFLFGSSDPLEWWIPDCLDGCTFSESFSEAYPEIVEISL